MRTGKKPENAGKISENEDFTDDPVLAAELDAIGREENGDGGAPGDRDVPAGGDAPEDRDMPGGGDAPGNGGTPGKSEKPASRKKRRGIPPAILTVMIVALVSVALYSGYQIFLILRAYQVGKNTYSGIIESAVSTTEAGGDDTSGFSYNNTAETTANGELVVNFDILKKINPQIVAWIYSPETMISYPIVQGTDNSYYLNHLSDGTYNASGSIFADCRNNLFQDTNTILFGHHMKDGSMFRSLVNYEKQSYYDKHPIMYVYTPDAKYELRLIAGAIIPGSDSYYNAGVGYEADISSSISEIIDSSTFRSDETYTSGDRLVTLSTCTYEYDDARYVVVGKLVQVN